VGGFYTLLIAHRLRFYDAFDYFGSRTVNIDALSAWEKMAGFNPAAKK
jgi:hypothetical protein